MKREIKFRAWDKDAKSMRDWEHLLTIIYYYDDCFFNDPDFILMQFTGLKDKFGKEIFEGDILSTLKSKRVTRGGKEYIVIGEQIPDIIEVRWNEGILCTGWSISRSQAQDGEIIGNIYENKDLLND